jgi:copper(I)-binding protein
MLLRGRRASAPSMSPAHPTAAPAAPTRRAAQPRARGLRRLGVAAVAALVPALAGCEAGLNPPVMQWHPPVSGASLSIRAAQGSGYLAIRNVFVLGPVPGSTIPAGGSAGVFLAMANTGPRDHLMSITAPGTATSVDLPSGGVAVERSNDVLLDGPTPTVVLRGLTHSLGAGGYVRLVLKFQNAGSVGLTVPVMARAAEYTTYSPAPSPSPTATAGRKHKHHPGAASTASPTPTP